MPIPDSAELERKVRIVLSQASKRIYEHTDSARFRARDYVPKLPAPGAARIVNDQLELLGLLYSDLATPLRPEFARILLANLTEENAAVVTHALLDASGLLAVDRALEPPQIRFPLRKEVWATILDRLVMESHRFSEADLDQLQGMADRDFARAQSVRTSLPPLPSGASLLSVPPSAYDLSAQHVELTILAIARVIGLARYLKLGAQLREGANPEINTDRRALVSRMESLGFRPEISAALDELDRRLAVAGKPIEFKTCVDLARTAYEEIVEDAARKTATKTGRPLPPAEAKDFQPWNQLLMNDGVLSAEEGDLFQKLYNYLSNVGAHRLGSEPEHVRIAKNVVIEFGLLLLGRVQALIR